jgi:rubrerythrin
MDADEKNSQRIGDIPAFVDIESDHAAEIAGNASSPLSNLLKLAEDGSISSLGPKGEDESVLDDISVATGAGRNALKALLYEVGSCSGGDHQQVCLDSKGEDEAVLDDSDSSVATGAGMHALKALIKQAQQNTLSNTSGKKSKRERSSTQELHDKELFTQPDDTHEWECPLCFLRMPLDPHRFYSCCSKIICNGCDMKNGDDRCPFCREPEADEEENKKRVMKRIKANDPGAMRSMGWDCYDEGDYDTAVKYWTKAAELGDAHAHHNF